MLEENSATAGWDDATRAMTRQDLLLEARLTIEGRGPETISGAGPWLLGRDDQAHIAFPDDRSCSRRQALILRVRGGFALEPLSRNVPTTVNDAEISGVEPLSDGTRIGFGTSRMVFTLVDSAFAEATMMGRPFDAVQSDDRLPIGAGLAIGRQAHPGQAVFDHPSVSRRHAMFEPGAGGIVVRDLGSTNGTFVNGARIDRPKRLGTGDRIDIGPFQFTLDGDVLTSVARTGNADLMVSDVGFDVRAGSGRAAVRILDGANFHIAPREFVCIVGASGSGKSTLMNILAGRAAPATGGVSLNGVDLHASFAALKQDIAFVPQQDVLHEQLTLRQGLDYAARLRLPRDTSAAQRRVAVENGARAVDLFDRLDTRIGALSGGQKKRASLASEILNRPSLLFLDEVTSGLDEITDREIMKLLRRLADEGMTIVVVTHTLANVEAYCHKVVCMGRGGHTTFVGAPEDALTFFGVRRLGEIFGRIEDDGPRVWRARFEDAAPPGIRSPEPSGGAEPPRHAKEGFVRHLFRSARQFAILTDRNTRLLLADRRTLIMAAAQSVLIGGLMGYAFGTFGIGQEKINGENALLFLLGLTSIWLGCNGASKEIVGELIIYKRERDINLSTAAFVASKFLVTGLFTVAQLLIVFALTAALAQRIPGWPPSQLGILIAGALAGTAIGLAISALSNTRDQATTIVPLALVPQIILAGILVPRLPAPAEAFAKLAVSAYWLTESMKSVFIAADGPIRIISARTGALVDMTAGSARIGVPIVIAHTVVFLLAAYFAALLRHGGSR